MASLEHPWRRLRGALAARVSPESTRRATRLERYTVQRLSEAQLVRMNTVLELAGKLATGLWVLFLLTIVLGVDWRQVVESLANAGRPVRGAIALALVVPTLLFVAARSLIGFARWRLQREMWRRDLEGLGGRPRPPTP